MSILFYRSVIFSQENDFHSTVSNTSAGVTHEQAILANLEDGEEVLGNVAYGWLSYIRLLIIGTILLPIYGAGLLVFLYVYQKKKKSGCVVTNHRIVQTSGGLMSSKTKEIRINDIRSISTYEGWNGGGVKLDTGAGDIRIGMSNPMGMANVIREEMNRQEGS